MRGYTLARLLTTITVALLLAVALYVTHPDWFNSKSNFTLPISSSTTPTPGATAAPAPTRATPHPVATVPRIDMTQHIDDIWVTPFKVDHSQGSKDTAPNRGNEFLVVHVHIQNRSQVDYPVRTSDFVVLDSHGELDPPIVDTFTRQGLREVRLIPKGFIRGVLVFEVPLNDPISSLIYQPDPLDPSKRKEWLLQ